MPPGHLLGEVFQACLTGWRPGWIVGLFSCLPVNLKAICFQVLACAPIDLVKVRLQGQTTSARYRGPVHCVTVILKAKGLRGLFRGGLALALRDIPCYGFYFFIGSDALQVEKATIEKQQQDDVLTQDEALSTLPNHGNVLEINR
uniref:Uncharacterized protein n=1 Tax=Amphilophus citrinellus TaxID=61819 RepID=A0A3Q0S4F3_AMPCI